MGINSTRMSSRRGSELISGRRFASLSVFGWHLVALLSVLYEQCFCFDNFYEIIVYKRVSGGGGGNE